MESDLAELPGSVIVLPVVLSVSATAWSDFVLGLPVPSKLLPTSCSLSNIG